MKSNTEQKQSGAIHDHAEKLNEKELEEVSGGFRMCDSPIRKKPDITKDKLEKLSDEELNKVAGGTGFPCNNLRCRFINNHCVCPDED